MARKKRRRLGDILLEWGVTSQQSIEEALTHGRAKGLRIGEALVALNLASEEDVAKALASQFDMEYLDLAPDTPAPEAHLLPDEVVRNRMVLPLSRDGNKLKVVITDPLDLEAMDMLRFRLNCEIQPCLTSKAKFRAYLGKSDPASSDVSIDAAVDEIRRQTIDLAPGEAQGLDLLDDDGAAPIVRLVTMLITQAVEMRASDIHVEPMSNRVRVRYRIDGICIDREPIPKRMQGSVVNRLKIMAGMDLAEKRLPLDGRIKMAVGGSSIDFRVSSVPGYHGESVVLRILRPESVRLGIPALGFEQDDYERFLRIIRRPNGMFLVTGPTGSGKTTTLYAAINELNRPDRKIITAEDPVEYNFTGVNQVQVNEAINLTFARILRAMLRQAPNIILVGEIRDLAVAEVAIQAALTGHLVFSTLHTNDAPSAMTRLIDMGVKPFLVASSIQAVMAQRLIRVICTKCKQADKDVDPRMLRMLGFSKDEAEGVTFYKGRGCDNCHGTGYRGRQGIFELMIMNNELRELAFRQGTLADLRRAAIAGGMRNLLADGRLKIVHGVTTPDEVLHTAQTAE
ncbi:MAG: GspE/PulE family protein, partial [Phycisphaerae bacterium]|nr:GspE/PulE family protein [Phycisphaerae bacterium]